MPFISQCSNLVINHDIRYDRFDPISREFLQKGNGLKPLSLTKGANCNYRADTESFKRLVWRGTPDQEKMTWIHPPVYRILTDGFNIHEDATISKQLAETKKDFPKLNYQELKKKAEESLTEKNWQRFLDFYEQNRFEPARHIYFEPDLSDILVIEDIEPSEQRHLPLWVLEQLMEDGTWAECLNMNKIGQPGVKMVDDRLKERFLTALEKRREAESPNENTSSKKTAEPVVNK